MTRYRLYYNRSEDAPYVWSFDRGTQATEETVCDFLLHRCDARAGVDMDAPKISQDRPRVWVEIEAASMQVVDGIAHFYAAGDGDGRP